MLKIRESGIRAPFFLDDQIMQRIKCEKSTGWKTKSEGRR